MSRYGCLCRSACARRTCGRRSSKDSRDGLIESGEHEIFRGSIDTTHQAKRGEALRGQGKELTARIKLVVRSV